MLRRRRRPRLPGRSRRPHSLPRAARRQEYAVTRSPPMPQKGERERNIQERPRGRDLVWRWQCPHAGLDHVLGRRHRGRRFPHPRRRPAGTSLRYTRSLRNPRNSPTGSASAPTAVRSMGWRTVAGEPSAGSAGERVGKGFPAGGATGAAPARGKPPPGPPCRAAPPALPRMSTAVGAASPGVALVRASPCQSAWRRIAERQEQPA